MAETTDLNKKITRVLTVQEKLGIDAATNALEVIDYVHHEIHAGSHYFFQGAVEMGTTTTPLRIKIVTPDSTKWAHFVFKVTSSGIAGHTLDEDATGGMTGGTAKVPFNSDRNSTKASDLVVTIGVDAATSYAARLNDDKWGAAGFKEGFGGSAGREDELILKANTTYLKTITSYAASNLIQYMASWYEHTNK